MLDYRIETFLTLYKEMNYRKTAELLNMTQPGVTQHIHYLERYYGVRLFTYDGRQLHRTEGARVLKRHIDSVLAKERILREELEKSPKTHLDVGATKTIGEFVLNDVLQRYLSKEAHTLDFVIDNTEKLLEMLEDAKLDFALVEGVFDKEKYPHHLYKKERFVGICAKTHPFAGRVVTLSELFEETIILREVGSGTRHLFEQSVLDLGYSLECFKRSIVSSNFSVITNLVSKGTAITFGYMPVATNKTDLSTFTVEDMHVIGEFNFVYCDEEVAQKKIELFMGYTV